MVVNTGDTSDSSDIRQVLEQLGFVVEQLPDLPDWLWQSVVANLLTDALGLAAWLAWKHRKKIAEILPWSTPSTQTIHAGSIPSEESFGEARVVQIGGVPSDELVGSLTVSSDLRALWNVKASTRTKRLVKEGLELLSWYVRQR